MNQIYEELAKEYAESGMAAALQTAETKLRSASRYHELFEVLKMKSRQALGLPLLHQENVEISEEDHRKLDEGLLTSCRDVGFALLKEGQIQDSWVYLRHLNENENVLRELHQLEVTEENLEQVLGLLLYEGLEVKQGYALVLEHYGTCNAITTMQQAMYGRSKEDRRATGKLLVAHVHNELLENVKAHVMREENASPNEDCLMAIITNRDFLFADGTYHIDTSHLSSTIQIAIELVDKESLELALDMTRYGERLDAGLQYPGDPPFENLYPDAGKFLAAQLGQDTEQALAFFRDRAKATDAHQEGTLAIEAYIDLLARVGRPAEAIQAAVDLIPAGIQTTGRAPSFYDLSEQLGSFDRYRELCTQRDDLLGYLLSLGK